MSTVQEYIKCPQCGGIFNHTVNTGNGEQYDVCDRCGKKYRKHLRLDTNKGDLRGETENSQYIILDCFGYGVMGIRHTDGSMAVYQLSKPYQESMKECFLELLQQDCVDEEGCYMTCWNAEKKRAETVYGTFPPSFEDFIADNWGNN